jgi:hypothetical protein
VEFSQKNAPNGLNQITKIQKCEIFTAELLQTFDCNNILVQDEQRYRLMCELSAAKRRADRLEVKIKKIKELIEKAAKQGASTLEVRKIR